MKYNRKSLLVLSILLFGSIFIAGTTSTSSGLGTIHSSVEAGDTYYYEITDFPTFNELLDLTGASDGFNSTEYVDITGDLTGSQIYVKVMHVTEESMTYWDGQNEVEAMVPTIDVATGLITGQSITIEVATGGEVESTTVPAGIGLPIPVLFGSTSVFNASSILNDMILPLPIVLSDDYSIHEAVMNDVSLSLPSGAVAVTNDGSQFKADFVDIQLDSQGDVYLDGLISYKKPSGLLQEINLEVTNETSGEILFNLDIDLVAEEHYDFNVAVGDTFELAITDAGFSHSVTSSDADVQSEANQILTEINANLTSMEGTVLFEFEVVEVRGLYYSIEGSIYQGENEEAFSFPTNDGYNEDLWMHGFGRLGPGVPLPTDDPGQTYRYEEVYNEDFNYWEYVQTDDPLPLRERALPGPFATPDYKIYAAWDNTIDYFTAVFNEQLNTVLTAIEDIESEVVFSSSTTDDVQATIDFTSDSTASSYGGWELAADVDANIWVNETSSFDNISRYTEFSIIGDASLAVNYDNTVLTSIVQSGNLDFSFTYDNSTHVDTLDLTISDFIFELSVSTTVDPYTGNADDGTEEAPGLGLPGFELFGAVFTVASIGIIVNFRRRR